MTHRSFKTKIHNHSVRSHRKSLLPVGGSCLSAGGGGGGGRYMRGLRESTHTHAYDTRHIHTCAHTFITSFSPPAAPCLGLHRRESESLGEKKGSQFHLKCDFFFNQYVFQYLMSVCVRQSMCVSLCVCVCVCVSVCVCNGHTVWCLCVADGGHSFQGRFQRKLNVGHHWAEGGRLLCGDLHGKCINRQSQTQAPTHTHTHTHTHTRMHTHTHTFAADPQKRQIRTSTCT